MNVESRLRTAMRTVDDPPEGDLHAALGSVKARARTARRRRRVLLGAASAIVAIVPVAVFVVTRDGEPGTVVSPSPTVTPSTTPSPTGPPTVPPTVAPTTSVRPTTSVPAPPPGPEGVLWPAPYRPTFDDPVDAARSFVFELVGVDNPVLGEFRATIADEGEVDVFGRDESLSPTDDVVSTVHLRQVDGAWYVTAAAADSIQLDEPTPGAEIGAPLQLSGRAAGFEGTLQVQIREEFAVAGDVIAEDFISGVGCCGEPEPFTGAVEFETPAAERGLALVYNGSGLFSLVDFSVVPVTFRDAGGTPPTPPVVPADALWPGPGRPAIDDPVAAARSFVVELVGITNPPLSEFRATGADTGEVDVLARAEGGGVREGVVSSTLALRRVDDGWFVTEARSEDIRIDTPAPGAEVVGPLELTGRAIGDEGSVSVEVREAFALAGDVLAEGRASAGVGELAPMDGVLDLPPPSTERGLVLVHNGGALFDIDSFAVISISFGPP